MSDWTAARLEAMTPGTVVELDTCDSDWLIFDGEEWWETCESHPRVWSSAALAKAEADSPGSIRVVSVPVAALLSDELEDALPDLIASPWDLVGIGAIRAAIAHVTGEAA